MFRCKMSGSLFQGRAGHSVSHFRISRRRCKSRRCPVAEEYVLCSPVGFKGNLSLRNRVFFLLFQAAKKQMEVNHQHSPPYGLKTHGSLGSFCLFQSVSEQISRGGMIKPAAQALTHAPGIPFISRGPQPRPAKTRPAKTRPTPLHPNHPTHPPTPSFHPTSKGALMVPGSREDPRRPVLSA